MSIRAQLRLLPRELRGLSAHSLLFAACLGVGVAALVVVGALAAAVAEGVEGRARELVGADLVVEAFRPPPEELDAFLESRPEIERTIAKELATMAAVPGASESQIVELRAIEGTYPVYGRLSTQPSLKVSDLGPEQAIVAPALLEGLDLGLGDELSLGGSLFTVAAVIIDEPDPLRVMALGPRVLMSAAGLERTGLEALGSRIRHRHLLALPASDGMMAEATAAELREVFADDPFIEVEAFTESQPPVQRGLERVRPAIGLAALLSLIVGAVGVAHTARWWLAARLDDLAVLRCIGWTPAETRTAALLHTGTLAAIGSLLGAGAGLLVLAQVPRVLPDLVPVGFIDPWQPLAAIRGVVVGVTVALVACLPTLLAAGRVSPLRALRRRVEGLPAARGANMAVAIASFVALVAIARLQSGSWLRGAGFALGLALTTAVLALAALGVGRLARVLAPRIRGVALRAGIASLARPDAGGISAIVALGLGTLVIVASMSVHVHVIEAMDADLPREAPSAFFVDVQPKQWGPLEALLRAEGAERPRSVPVVMARLSRVDGRSVAELAEAGLMSKWALTREQRLTWMDELPEDNVMLAGSWWADDGIAGVSVERDFAADLGLVIGSGLSFDVQGVPVELVVTSIREVDWSSFAINFFLVAEPGVLDRAPHDRLATAMLPAESSQRIQNLVTARFPNVTTIDLRSFLDTLTRLLERLGDGVLLLGAFTVLAGLVVLAATVSAQSTRRRGEIAVLKTLGMTRGQAALMLASEHAALGSVGGLLGAIAGLALSWAVVTQGMELVFTPPWLLALGALVATVLLASLTSMLAGWRALNAPPLLVLREE